MVSLYETRVKKPETTDSRSRSIVSVLAQYAPISLSEMSAVSLMNRTDTKYVMRESQLYAVLQQLSDKYRVLDINGVRLNHYQTLYFDTPDFLMYQQHHNGLRSRYKVRMREYVDSDLAFFEVKHKTVVVNY